MSCLESIQPFHSARVHFKVLPLRHHTLISMSLLCFKTVCFQVCCQLFYYILLKLIPNILMAVLTLEKAKTCRGPNLDRCKWEWRLTELDDAIFCQKLPQKMCRIYL